MTWGHSRQPIGVHPCLSPSRLEGGLQRLALVPWPPVALSRHVQCSLLLAPHHLVVGLAWNLFSLLSGDTWPSPWPPRLHTSSLGLHVACPPQAWAVHHMSSFCPRKHGLRAGDTPPPPRRASRMHHEVLKVRGSLSASGSPSQGLAGILEGQELRTALALMR